MLLLSSTTTTTMVMKTMKREAMHRNNDGFDFTGFVWGAHSGFGVGFHGSDFDLGVADAAPKAAGQMLLTFHGGMKVVSYEYGTQVHFGLFQCVCYDDISTSLPSSQHILYSII